MHTTTCPEADRLAQLYGFTVNQSEDGYQLCRGNDVYHVFPTEEELQNHLNNLMQK